MLAPSLCIYLEVVLDCVQNGWKREDLQIEAAEKDIISPIIDRSSVHKLGAELYRHSVTSFLFLHELLTIPFGVTDGPVCRGTGS